MGIDVVISHAAWAKGRGETLSSLLDDFAGTSAPCVLTSYEKEHANIWARKAWEWGASQTSASHICFLNDDVHVPPGFLDICGAMTEAVPDVVIALHTSTPRMPDYSKRWQRAYWLTGPGYIVPRALLPSLCDFADSHRNVFTGHYCNEDGLIMRWSWHHQRPIWHCIPALVVHDTSVQSTLGYDNHTGRESNVPWQNIEDISSLKDPKAWAPERPAMVACPWMTIDQLKISELRGDVRPKCAFCNGEQFFFESARTGIALCKSCIAELSFIAQGGKFQ